MSTEYSDSVTRCICDENDDQDGFMLCCEKCNVWQHGDCVGVAEENEPEEYFCEVCMPNHPIHVNNRNNKNFGKGRRGRVGGKRPRPRTGQRKEKESKTRTKKDKPPVPGVPVTDKKNLSTPRAPPTVTKRTRTISIGPETPTEPKRVRMSSGPQQLATPSDNNPLDAPVSREQRKLDALLQQFQ